MNAFENKLETYLFTFDTTSGGARLAELGSSGWTQQDSVVVVVRRRRRCSTPLLCSGCARIVLSLVSFHTRTHRHKTHTNSFFVFIYFYLLV